jgi:hypothetical protein
MKKSFLFCMLIGCASVVWLGAQQDGSAAGNQEVEAKVKRTLMDLRMMETAVEAYKIDNYTYPTHLPALTTPVSYLTKILPDVFQQEKNVPNNLNSSRLLEGQDMNIHGHLKIGVVENPCPAYILYGVGPDGKDNGGLIPYDPTNGTLSEGDIVRIISFEEIPFVFSEPDIRDPLRESYVQLHAIKDAIYSYGMVNRSIPTTIANLTTPIAYLSNIPNDPFSPSNDLKSILSEEGKALAIRIYSVGPDGDDDSASIRYFPNLSNRVGELNGDVFLEVSNTKLLNRLFPYRDESRYKGGVNPWAAALDGWQKENPGKDNALIWYQKAASLSTLFPTEEQNREFERILYEGEGNEALLRPWLNLWAESFESFQRGSTVGYAEGPKPHEGVLSAEPEYSPLQNAFKAFSAESFFSAKSKDSERASEKIITLLRVSSDQQSNNMSLMSHLHGYSGIINVNLTLNQIIKESIFSKEDLIRITSELKYAESNRSPLKMAIICELEANTITLKNIISNPELVEKINKSRQASKLEPIDGQLYAERLAEIYNSTFTSLLSDLEKEHIDRKFPTPVLPTVGLSQYENNFLSKFLENLPNYAEISRREAVMLAFIRVQRVRIAQLIYEMENGQPADTLEKLAPLLGGEVPIDPFTGKAIQFSYSLEEGSKFWSVGPDLVDQQGNIFFEPRNGYESTGDIVFRN